MTCKASQEAIYVYVCDRCAVETAPGKRPSTWGRVQMGGLFEGFWTETTWDVCYECLTELRSTRTALDSAQKSLVASAIAQRDSQIAALDSARKSIVTLGQQLADMKCKLARALTVGAEKEKLAEEHLAALRHSREQKKVADEMIENLRGRLQNVRDGLAAIELAVSTK